MSELGSRLGDFKKQIASENANSAAVESLGRLGLLPTPSRKDRFSLAMIASPSLTRDFDRSAQVIRLDKTEWRAQIERARPDIVLVETTFDETAGWRGQMLSGTGERSEIRKVAHYCEKEQIACAIWFTLGHRQIEAFRPLLNAFPLIFVAEDLAFATLAALYTDRRVLRMFPCVDTTLYNPARQANPLEGLFPVTADCLSPLMFNDKDDRVLDFLQKTTTSRSWLYETEEYVRPRESYIPAHMVRRSLGLLDETQSANLLKLSDISLVFEAEGNWSYWHHHRKVLKAFACKSLCCFNRVDLDLFSAPLRKVIERYVLSESPDDFSRKLERLLQVRLLRERLQHLVFRDVMTRHSVDARLGELREAIGHTADPAESASPLVSVILPTNRPENFEFGLERYRDQDYQAKELIVVLNTEAVDAKAVRRQLRDSDNARILIIPPRWSIGVCLNAAIEQAQGAFWAKFDDDDIYGPSYLSDYVLNSRFVDFDIAGKSSIFFYDERNDRTFLRRSKEPFHAPAMSFAGGSLFVKTSVSDGSKFFEEARGLVDIWYQLQRHDQGALLYATDPFNFVQVRRADRRSHTWRIEVAELGEGDNVPGLSLEVAFA